MNINVGTFNIQHGKNYPHFLKTGESVIDLESCVRQIRETKLDICGLNEVYNEERTGNVNQAKFIGESLGYHYYFARAIDIENGEYGNALISRFPIKSTETFPIEIKKEERTDSEMYENRVLLHAVIDIDGKELSVYVCHFGLVSDEQLKAEKIIADVIKNDEKPVVLMGDFNITPDNKIIKNFKDFLFDTSELVSGNILTFPSDTPTKRIDYIFINKKIKALNAAVPEVSCSDHREYTVSLSV